MATIGQVQTINGNFTVNGKPLTKGMTISSGDVIKGNGAISVALTDGRTINLKGDVEQLFDETMVANIEDMEDGAISQESLDAVIDYTVPSIEEELASAQEENPETVLDETAAGQEQAPGGQSTPDQFAARDGSITDIVTDLRDAQFPADGITFDNIGDIIPQQAVVDIPVITDILYLTDTRTITVVETEAWTEVINHPEVSHQELVTEAWTETIEHPAVTHEELVTAAWTETIEHPEVNHQELVTAAYTETIEHPAVTHQEVDVAGHYETETFTNTREVTAPADGTMTGDGQLNNNGDSAGFTFSGETTSAIVNVKSYKVSSDEGRVDFYLDGAKVGEATLDSLVMADDSLYNNGTKDWNTTSGADINITLGGTAFDSFTIVHTGGGVGGDTVTEDTTVSGGGTDSQQFQVDTASATITYTEEFQDTREVWVDTTYTIVVDTPSWTETIDHPDVYTTVVDTPAYDETIDHPAVYETITDVAAYTETIEHDAVYTTVIDEAAWTETIAHNGLEQTETATITYEQGVSDTEINTLFNDIFEDYNADQVIDTNSYVGDRIASVDLQVTEQIIQDI